MLAAVLMLLAAATMAATVAVTALRYLRRLHKLPSDPRTPNDGLPAAYYHSAAACDGPCAIHGPSAHHMADWPRQYHVDNGIFERRCTHNHWHPDPDSLARLCRVLGEDEGWGASVHGCACRCCLAPDGEPETAVR